MKFGKVILAAAVAGAAMLLGGVSAKADTVYDAVADFSAASNPNGVWSYGHEDTLGARFDLFGIKTTFAGHTGINEWRDTTTPDSVPGVWKNNTGSDDTAYGTVLTPAGALGMHPGSTGEVAVVRFTAPAAGQYNIAASFMGLDFVGQTTTDVHVLKNGISQFDKLVNGYSDSSKQSFAKSIALVQGDTIDFAVGTGSNHNYYYDSTRLSATVTAVPLPGAAWMGLVLLGGLGAFQIAKRKLQVNSL